MNERIKRLTEQAGLKIEYQMINPPKPLQILGSAEQFEKFAELIVRECAEVINGDIMYQVDRGVVSNVFGLNQARELIKEHFGVEE